MFRVAIFSLLIVSTVAANPPGRKQAEPTPAPMKKAIAAHKLAGVTNWGDFTAFGPRDFTLDNHPTWSGVGRVRDDGSVLIIWTLRTTEEVAPGVYRVDVDGSLIGCWGFARDTTIEDNGELTGNVRGDRVYVLPPPEPEI